MDLMKPVPCFLFSCFFPIIGALAASILIEEKPQAAQPSPSWERPAQRFHQRPLRVAALSEEKIKEKLVPCCELENMQTQGGP